MPEQNTSFNEKEVLEYDIYLRMPVEQAHLVGYLSEADDHIMNIRHAKTPDSTLKIVVPADMFDEAMKMLELLKEEIDLEVVRYEPNPGHP